MSSTISVPVKITPEADAFIDEAGKRKTYERLLEQLPRHYSRVRSIAVVLEPASCDGYPAQIIFEVALEDPTPDASEDIKWHEWVIAHFPPEESSHFVVLWHPA